MLHQTYRTYLRHPALLNIYKFQSPIMVRRICPPIFQRPSNSLVSSALIQIFTPAQLIISICSTDEARQNDAAVLIHCLAGISRSVTVTMAYLMHARLLNFEEAFALVRLRKPDISPNFHFLRQLHAFERKLVDESPSRMVGN